MRFVRSNGRKTTFEWPKVISEVSFPRFWGVFCIAKCFCFFVRFGDQKCRFYEKSILPKCIFPNFEYAGKDGNPAGLQIGVVL